MVASGEYDDMDWSKDSLFFLANSMVGFGACESAIDTYTRAISMSGGMMPKGVTARSYLHRGIVNYKLGNVEVAKQDFDAAIDLDSSIGSSYGSEAILPGLNIKVECKAYGRRG